MTTSEPSDEQLLASVAELWQLADPPPVDLADGVLARLAVEDLEHELLVLVETRQPGRRASRRGRDRGPGDRLLVAGVRRPGPACLPARDRGRGPHPPRRLGGAGAGDDGRAAARGRAGRSGSPSTSSGASPSPASPRAPTGSGSSTTNPAPGSASRPPSGSEETHAARRGPQRPRTPAPVGALGHPGAARTASAVLDQVSGRLLDPGTGPGRQGRPPSQHGVRRTRDWSSLYAPDVAEVVTRLEQVAAALGWEATVRPEDAPLERRRSCARGTPGCSGCRPARPVGQGRDGDPGPRRLGAPAARPRRARARRDEPCRSRPRVLVRGSTRTRSTSRAPSTSPVPSTSPARSATRE